MTDASGPLERGTTALRRHGWLSLRRRHRSYLVFLVASAVLAVFLATVGLLSSSETLLGIPGSGVALIVVLAAVLAGPLVGVLVSATAGVLFYVFVADLGDVGTPIGTLGGVAIWVASAFVAGRVADAMRTSAEQRDVQQETAVLYEALEAGLLPRLPFTHPGLNVITRYVPSERRLNLGGDFLDIVGLESSLAMILGDVAGHGPVAAALGANLRSTWRGLILAGSDPPTVLATLNRTVFWEEPPDGAFVTLCLAWLDMRERRLTYMSVGHPPMLLIGEDGTQPLETHPTLPLGVAAHIKPVFTDVPLADPWTLFAYTDGLIEGREAPVSITRYGEHRLIGELSGMGPQGLTDESVDRLLRDIRAANGGPAADDIAVVVISGAGFAAQAASETMKPSVRN
jgi:serine phosphatase RsbU (regulator of sigma subunit)